MVKWSSLFSKWLPIKSFRTRSIEIHIFKKSGFFLEKIFLFLTISAKFYFTGASFVFEYLLPIEWSHLLQSCFNVNSITRSQLDQIDQVRSLWRFLRAWPRTWSRTSYLRRPDLCRPLCTALSLSHIHNWFKNTLVTSNLLINNYYEN